MNFKVRLTRIEVCLYTLLVNFILFGLYFAHTNLEYFEGTFVVEDGLVEWLTVLALVASSLLCIKRIVTFRKKKNILFLSALAFFAIGFLFGAGEEISWGQRIFNIQSSEFFMANNSQGETNLHNLVVGETKINKLFFGLILGIIIAVYNLIFPIAYRKVFAIKKLADKLAIPVPRWHHVFAYLILFLLVEINPSPKRGELIELGGTAMFFMIFLNPWNWKLFSTGQRNHHHRAPHRRPHHKRPHSQRHHKKPATQN